MDSTNNPHHKHKLARIQSYCATPETKAYASLIHKTLKTNDPTRIAAVLEIFLPYTEKLQQMFYTTEERTRIDALDKKIQAYENHVHHTADRAIQLLDWVAYFDSKPHLHAYKHIIILAIQSNNTDIQTFTHRLLTTEYNKTYTRGFDNPTSKEVLDTIHQALVAVMQTTLPPPSPTYTHMKHSLGTVPALFDRHQAMQTLIDRAKKGRYFGVPPLYKDRIKKLLDIVTQNDTIPDNIIYHTQCFLKQHTGAKEGRTHNKRQGETSQILLEELEQALFAHQTTTSY